MGTRGFVAFVADERETVTYNHWDSYPEGLGIVVLEFVRELTEHTEVEYREKAAHVKHVDDDVPPTRDQVVELIGHANLGVSTGQAAEWYVLLRETHGKPGLILDVGYAEHAPKWPLDSLFAEWGYVIDFDRRKLEVYTGFQHSVPEFGRWAGLSPEPRYEGDSADYHAVGLAKTYDFDDLPTSDAFVKELEKEEDE
jgi:hypothetical protein